MDKSFGRFATKMNSNMRTRYGKPVLQWVCERFVQYGEGDDFEFVRSAVFAYQLPDGELFRVGTPTADIERCGERLGLGELAAERIIASEWSQPNLLGPAPLATAQAA